MVVIENSSYLSIDFKGAEKIRVLNLADAVLNLNFAYNEPISLKELYKGYSKIFEGMISEDFKKSMEISRELINTSSFNPDSLDDATLNHTMLKKEANALFAHNKDSFLIIPLESAAHMLSAVIRKDGNDFSFTVVNKGARDTHLYNPYEQYKIKATQINRLLDDLEKNKNESVDTIYECVHMHSNGKEAIVNQPKTNQKTDNCFIKEPENAIQFALETLNNSNGKKWLGKTTQEVHRDFIDYLKKTYPMCESELSERYRVYTNNKNLKDLFVGVTKDKINDLQQNIVNALLKDVSMSNLSAFTKEIAQYLIVTKQRNKLDLLAKTVDIRIITGDIMKNELKITTEKFNRIKKDLTMINVEFGQLKNELSVALSRQTYYSKEVKDFKLQVVDKLYTNEPFDIKGFNRLNQLFDMVMELDPNNSNAAREQSRYLKALISCVFESEKLKKENGQINCGGFGVLKNIMKRPQPLELVNKKYEETLKKAMELSSRCVDLSEIKELASNLSLSKRRTLKTRLIQENIIRSNNGNSTNNDFIKPKRQEMGKDL